MELKMIQAMDAYYPHVDGVVNVVDNYAHLYENGGRLHRLCARLRKV